MLIRTGRDSDVALGTIESCGLFEFDDEDDDDDDIRADAFSFDWLRFLFGYCVSIFNNHIISLTE
jgi:hypothetical protein